MKPISMYCTQQDWADIKPILEKHTLKFVQILSFRDYPYLITNYNGNLGSITNMDKTGKAGYNRTIYEQWDKNIFLEACDIKTKFTIEDLANGKCAVINDGTLDELSKVLEAAFPNFLAQGDCKFYIANSRKTSWLAYDKLEEFNLPTQSVKDFLIQEIKTNMDNRFPFSLKPINAQKIINIACPEWKTKLAKFWAVNIILNQYSVVDEEFYKEMRKACTPNQHRLFDSIFGKDIEECPYKDGELIWVKSNDFWQLKYSNGKLTLDGHAIVYNNQLKSGFTSIWSKHQPAPGVKLPD